MLSWSLKISIFDILVLLYDCHELAIRTLKSRLPRLHDFVQPYLARLVVAGGHDVHLHQGDYPIDVDVAHF